MTKNNAMDNTSKITANKDIKSKPGMPKLILNDADRLYLATAVRSARPLTFVYTLVCARDDRGMFPLRPMTEIATFDNETDAKIYHKTVNAIMEHQKKLPGIADLHSVLHQAIEAFNARMR